jgi:hypothetical protein
VGTKFRRKHEYYGSRTRRAAHGQQVPCNDLFTVLQSEGA